ncbi:GNAT family N-acetyltransferase [Sulfitobacter aestuariivivens]|uniref:GNAT family N-acetyltransferase n=1 Tax=Sulfitobacter aestuariivivens TaxID=2766981 RepID=A0A927HFU8_9RHOB|nr:GNAT family N-acetyltransferase [Sulfitobacter aestuariivivens]MBD3664823.1 GNAT family N-acetyltransferase [Sulfitobacter aestuariivivens]
MKDGLYDIPVGKVAMVVTHLEMRAPHFRKAPCPPGVDFVQIDPDVATYRALFRKVGQDWLWYGRLVMEDSALDAILRDPAVQIFTLQKDGQAEALLELDFRKNTECELAYFGLSAGLIGTGAGAYLMDRAVERAFGSPIDRLHVHTCTIDSQQALAFYIRSGFAVTRQQVEIDDDPRIAGLLPDDVAPHVPLIRP